MRILFVENSFQKGGSFQSLNLIAKNLAQDHHVSIVYSNYKSHEHIKRNRIYYFYVNDGWFLSNFSSRVIYKINKHTDNLLFEKAGGFFESFQIRQFNRIIKNLGPDLIVFNNTPYIDHQFIKASSGYQCKKICHLRLINKQSIFNQRGFRELINREINRFVANSSHVKQTWAGKWGITEDKIEVIHNSVHEMKNGLSESIVRNITDGGGKARIACIGRINDEKGQEFLLNTILNNKSLLDSASFFFIGDGPLIGKLKSRVLSHKVNDGILFLGNVPNARNYMPLFDMTIVPSRCEPFGNVILESMQAGVPVIATDCCGPKEIITDGHDGVLVPYGNESGMLEAIQKFKNDRNFRNSIKTNAMRTFENRFSRDEFMRKLSRVYFE